VSEIANFRRSLSDAGIVYLDASVLALHLTADSTYLPLTRVVLAGIRDGELSGLTSALSVYQLLVEPYRSGAEGSAERIERLLSGLPGLDIVPVTPSIATQAAQVKAQIGGSLTRAVQIATALASDAELYVTPRSALRRIAGLGVIQLDAYRAPGPDGPVKVEP
jgi:hypothetical protein